MPGRKPIPTALKLITGKKGRGINPNEPRPELKAPSCPAYLSAAAKAEWKRVAPSLEAQGLLTDFDLAPLAAYCELYARWKKSLREIEKHGEIIVNVKGIMQTSPWVLIARSSEKEMRIYAGLFGMSPADRSKVNVVPKDKPGNPADRFFK